MRTKTDGATDSIEATRQKLAAVPGVTGNGQIQDLWREYFLSLGIKGNLNDQMNVFLSGRSQRQFQGRLPVLFNNFAYGHTSPGFTFDRNSETNGWVLRRTDDHILKDFAIDEPAFVIDPATGQSLGYRALAGFTNSLLWSRKLDDPAWSENGTITLSQDAVGLKGVANTAWTVTNTSGNVSSVSQIKTVADDSSPHVVSAHIGKDPDTSYFPALEARLQGGTTEVRYIVHINRATGETANELSDGTGTVTVEETPDFWRLTIAVTNNSTGNTSLEKELHPARGTTIGVFNNAATGSIVYDFGGVYLNSSIAGPAIETEGSPVSTVADDASEPLPTSCQDGFVWVCEFVTPPEGSDDSAKDLASVDDNGTTERLIVRYETNNNIRAAIISGNFSNISLVSGSSSRGQKNKVAVRMESGRYAICLNGGAVVSDTTSGFPTGLTRKLIGQSNGGLQWNSTVALDYLDPDPSAWTDADLQAATS